MKRSRPVKFKVFLINLDKSLDRFEACKSELDKYNIPFERIPAIYGKDLSEQELNSIYDQVKNKQYYKTDMSIGEIGCYLSHIKCWQKIIDDDLDYAVILEDDFKLSDNFAHFQSIFTNLKNWDFIRIAFASRGVPIVDSTRINNAYQLTYYKKVPINTLAQVVSKQGASKLLDSSQSIYRPIDVDLKHYWEKRIQVLGINPPLIEDRFDFDSEISDMSKGKGRESKSSLLRRLRYVTSFKFKTLFHNKKRPSLDSFIKDHIK